MPSPSPSSPVRHIPRSGIRSLMEQALADPLAIHLEIGEPDALLPQHVVEAVAESVDRGAAGYGPSLGLPELRAAAAARLTRRTGARVDPAQVVVTHGAMHGLAMAMATLLGPGDEVLLPDPVFPNWAMAAIASGAVPRAYRTRRSAGFVPSVDDVEAAITDRTRAIVVCSPNNPTGAVYPPGTVAALVELARRHDLWVLSDECYEQITFGVPHTSPAQYDTDGRVLVFHTMSKTFAMTGWRVGYVVVPDERVRESLGHLAEATVACPATTSQRAAVAALEGPQDWVHEAVESYWDRRDAAVALLEARGVRFVEPDGAFYLMVDVGVDDTEGFARSLLAHRHVAVAPGSAFGPGAHGMVRVSLAAPRDQLVDGLDRMVDHLRLTGTTGTTGTAGAPGAGRTAAAR